MWWFFLIGTAVFPLLMAWLAQKFRSLRFWFTLAASVSLILLSAQFAHALYQVIRDDELFMTTIHGIFANLTVQITGAYLGLYTIYMLHHYAAILLKKS